MSQTGGDAASQAPDLLAHLRMNQSNTPTSSQSHLPTSLPQTPFPTPQQAGIMSPSISSAFNAPHSTLTRTSAAPATQAGLLNLLKFGHTPASPQPSPQPAPATKPLPGAHGAPGRGQSASSDLLASFTGGKPTTPTAREKSQATSSINHQDALLRLLNKTTARPDDSKHKVAGSTDTVTKSLPEDGIGSPLSGKHPSVTDAKTSASSRHESPIRFFGSNEEANPTPFAPVVSPKADPSQKNDSIFTYVNPFEQLAASSPRNLKSKSSANGDKRKIKSPSPAAMHASSRRKLTPSGSEVLQSIESPNTDQSQHERSQIEALMGIGAPSRDAETVAEALNEVGDKVDRQVENALAQAEGKGDANEQGSDKTSTIKQESLEVPQHQSLKDIEVRAHNVAADVKKELDKEENEGLLEESMPKPVAEAIKDVIDEAADEKATDEGESTMPEQLIENGETSQTVSVYQFPMRPFVSIDLIQKDRSDLKFREEAVIHIARFKKDFDQSDRTLATATHDFIVYGMPKNGGIRIIQQDNGQHSSIFSKTQDRIFNVAISTGQSGSSMKSTQTIIATGVSGTVYWTTIAKPGEEVTQENMEKQGLMIPPVSVQIDSSSGGQLKTRAKKSNRHPEFFAIGRGKSIQIVFTANAQSSEFVTKEGLMDSEKYFAARNLKVTTGKAGKDFIFSEDDSAIASLDKTGKLRIWDIRELTDEANAAISLMTPIEVKSAIMTFSTARSTEKSWPTSILFVDKLRPYTKGTALRYIIVGMKQNHTLQLWDLCLGKAVQELSFPHESETDAICSVTYHPSSGIIAVGHPTRNSIYFIHLSAPKYNLPAMPQAKFMQRLANKDSTLPKAEATAIMSGMREYSFADKGQIRSIELVPSSTEPPRAAEDDDDPTLFELYVLHSKGVTCLGIKKEDLGWSKESRVLHSIDAEKEGHVIIKELREPSTASNSEPSTSANGESQLPPMPSRSKTPVKETAKPVRSVAEVGKTNPTVAEKPEKKRSKKNGALDPDSAPQAVSTPAKSELNVSATPRETTPTPQATPSVTQENIRPSVLKHASRDAPETTTSSVSDRPTRPIANGDSINLGISGDFLDKELKKIERGVSEEFNKVIGRELETLYRRFSDDKRVQDAAGAAKQDAMLRLVSSTLSDNVEKSLSRIIQQNIRDSVVPHITDTTSTALKANLSSTIAHHLDEKLATIMEQTMQKTIDRTMQSQQILHSISEQVTKVITGHVEQQFFAALDKSIVPAFTNLAVTVAQRAGAEIERRVREQMQHAEVQQREDSVKIDQLTSLVRGLSNTVQEMASAQSEFQDAILKQQQKAAESGRTQGHHHSPTPSESASMAVSPEQEELDAVNSAMNGGRFEEATVMWLQSQQQVELFDNLFVRCNPSYLRQTSPLVILSVGAAVTSSLQTNVMERLNWLETVFHSIDTRDPEIREVAGRILEVLSQRLEGEYMRIAENEPRSPALRRIPGLARHARELRGQTP